MGSDVVDAFGCFLGSVEILILVFTTRPRPQFFLMRDAIPYLSSSFLMKEGAGVTLGSPPYPHKKAPHKFIL